MNIKIILKDILLYYDTPQLFIARDNVGTNYLCMLVEQNQEFDIFVCIQMSKEKLTHFSTGHIDLRNVYLEPEIRVYYQVNIANYQSGCYEIVPLEYESIPDQWLPESGVFPALQ